MGYDSTFSLKSEESKCSGCSGRDGEFFVFHPKLFPFEAVGPNMALVIDDAGCALYRGTWRREGCHLPGFTLVCGYVHPNVSLLFHSEIGYGLGAVVR